MNYSFIVLISCIATIGGFLFGFDSGVINGTVDGLQIAFQSDSVGTGFNVASMLLGCAGGAFFAGRLADIIGRRTLLIAASICFLISAWGSGIAGSSAEFVMYRVLGGMAVGAASVIAPAYIGEVAPAHYRGRLITIQQIAIITGLFSAFVSNYLLAGFAGASTAELWLGFEAWRWMFWIEIGPAVLFFVGLLFIPESPRYLVIGGKMETARAVLTRLYGPDRGAAKLTEIDESLAGRPSSAEILGPHRRHQRTDTQARMGRHRPGHVPAIGRDQRRLLLRRGALAVGRVFRKRRIADQHHLGRRQHRRLPDHGQPDRRNWAANPCCGSGRWEWR